MAQNYFIVRNGLQIGNTQVINSSGVWIGPTIGSAGIWSSISSNTTANSGYNYIANTAAGSFVLTLPTSPSTGNNVTIVDGYNWSTNNLIVYPNGSTIENTSAFPSRFISASMTSFSKVSFPIRLNSVFAFAGILNKDSFPDI